MASRGIVTSSRHTRRCRRCSSSARRSGYTTALAVGKTKLIVLTRPGTLDRTYIGNEDQTDALDVARAASEFLHAVPRLECCSFTLGMWTMQDTRPGGDRQSSSTPLKRVDRAFEMVRQALRDRHLIERTVIILTADHGGAGTEHPPEDLRSQLIPWIVSGPSVREGFDLTSVTGLSVDTMATFATACALLGIDVPRTIDGKDVPNILNLAPQAR